MKTPGAPYRQTISHQLGVGAEVTRLVLGYMLAEHGTLDALSEADFRASAREALATVESDLSMAERVAQSFGI